MLHHGCAFEVRSSSGGQGSTLDVVEDGWDEEELDEHLSEVVDEEEWPEEPEVPFTPWFDSVAIWVNIDDSNISVEPDVDESNDVSSEWSEEGEWDSSLVEFTGEFTVKESDGSPGDGNWPVTNLHRHHDLLVTLNDSVFISDKVPEESEESVSNGEDSVPDNSLVSIHVELWHIELRVWDILIQGIFDAFTYSWHLY